jgi:hypothetical protein
MDLIAVVSPAKERELKVYADF